MMWEGRRKFEAIAIGEAIPPVEKTVTQEMINRWAEVSTDYNPLHVDPEFAKRTKFGGTIAHGHIALSFFCEMMQRWLGRGWVSGGKLMDVRFVAPVRPGYKITARGIVVEKRTEAGNNIVKLDIFIENQDGQKCVVGIAEGIVDE